MRGTAYFVRKPIRLSQLFKPQRIEDEVPYEIVKTIHLSQLDYENFSTDLTVDREYIEQNADFFGIKNGVWKCLLIQQKNAKDGILVIPEYESWIGYAAFYGNTIPRFPK